MNNKEKPAIRYWGYLIKKSKEFEETYVAVAKDYIVTEPVYGKYKAKKDYGDKTDLVLVDEKRDFFVYASDYKDYDGHDCLTDWQRSHVIDIIKQMSGSDKVKMYTYDPDIKTESVWPIFKNFNDMYDTLNAFMLKIDAVNSIDSLEIKPEKIDRKHIVVKKSFDTSYYVLGRPYVLKMKNHPVSPKIKSKSVVGVLTNIIDDSDMSFTIVEPSEINVPTNIVNIIISIDDVEKYDIEIMRAYDEYETMDMCKSIIDTYKSNGKYTIGECTVLDLPDHIIHEEEKNENDTTKALEPPMADIYSNYTYNRGDDNRAPLFVRTTERIPAFSPIFLSMYNDYVVKGGMITIKMLRRRGFEVLDKDDKFTNKYEISGVVTDNDESNLYFNKSFDNTRFTLSIESIIKENDLFEIIFE